MIKHFTAALLGASTLALAAPVMTGSFELAVLDSQPAPVVAPDGQSINELSGLAWDADEKRVYAVSDDGVLHHFRLEIADGKISSSEPVLSVLLKAGATPHVSMPRGLPSPMATMASRATPSCSSLSRTGGYPSVQGRRYVARCRATAGSTS